MYRILGLAILFLISHLPAGTLTGPITGKVVLDTAGSPWLITGDVIVEANDTLVIDPGVVVEFDSVSDDQAQGVDMSRAELYISGGVLLARGTVTDSIYFRSSASAPARDDWMGIYFYNNGHGHLQYCRIEHATYGVYCNNTDTDSVSIRNSYIGSTQRGIYSYYNYPSCIMEVDSCVIEDASSYGIYLYYPRMVTLADNRIHMAANNAIYLYYNVNDSEDSTVTVSGNHLTSDGGWYGIYCYDNRANLRNNHVDNFQYGIGSNIPSSSTPAHHDISGNTVINGTQGFYFQNYAQPVLRNNNIYGQGSYHIYNTSQRDIDAKNNYWGETTLAEMEAGGNPKDISGIYDQYENASSGLVNYSAWLDTADGSPVDSTVTAVLTLTDGPGTQRFGYELGDSVFVTLEDPDENTLPGTAETLTVLLTSDTETDAETLTVIETGVNTGVFGGFMVIDSAGTPAADGQLQAVAEDVIRAAFTDQANDFGEASAVTADALFGVTLASGSVSGRVTWTVSGSPYLVTGDVSVNAGDTLIIEPGVTVMFQAGQDDQSAGINNLLSELYVYSGGRLEAVGTPADSIIFTSNTGTPAPGDWQSINIADNGTARLEYCHIEYPVYGIYTNNTNIDTLHIKHNLVTATSNAGMYLGWNSLSCVIVVDSNRVRQTGSSGIYGYYPQNLIITNNRVDTTGSNGIDLRYNSSGNDTSDVIADNTINGTGSAFGIYTYNVRPPVTDNVIDEWQYGMYLRHSNNNPNAMTVTGNTVTGGQYSVRLYQYIEPTFRNNNFYGPSSYVFYQQSYRDIDAQNNYWGEDATAEMEAGGNPKNISDIYDNYDNPSYGITDYSAWLDTVNGIPAGTTVTGQFSITDGLGGPRDYFLAGETLYVEVADADGNTDPALIETVLVFVGSDIDSVPEPLFLAETDTNSGVFAGVVVPESTGVSAVDGLLQADKGNDLILGYPDAANTYGQAETTMTAVLFAPTLVPGYLLSGTETWTLAGSPYLVTGDVSVDNGDKLIIEPGVKVYFAAGSDDRAAGQNMSACEIYVTDGGRLEAVGTAADSITFTSIARNPALGDWEHIYFSNAAEGRIAYCRISYATSGIYGSWTSSPDSIVIRNSLIEQVSTGVYSNWTSSSAIWQIENNLIRRTVNRGCYMYFTDKYVIRDNTFDSPGFYGLYIRYSSSGNDSAGRIEDNTFINGSNYGIHLYRQRPAITGNTITGYDYGIYCDRAGTSFPPDQDISGNTITVGQYGIFLANAAAPQINYNNIYNQQYQVYNNSTSYVDARFNYWGESVTAEMEAGGNPKNISGIYDDFDNGTRGEVSYFGWLDTLDGTITDSAASGILLMVDGTDEEQIYYSPADTVYLILTDADLNADGGVSDTAWVYLSSTTETVPETVMLLETDAASDTFRGTILLQTSGTPAVNGTLEVQIDEFIYADYADTKNGFGVPENMQVSARYGVTQVSGYVSGQKTWTLAASPYLVTGDIIIETGNSLTIEPGVKVYFLENQDDQDYGQNTSLSEIHVDGGYLHAVGTAADSIIFTSYAETPAPGDWNTVYFVNSGYGRLDYCRIEYPVSGVTSAGTDSDSLVVRRSLIRQTSATGMNLSNSSGAFWLIDSCHIRQTASQGIYLNSIYDAVIANCVIDTPGGYGIYAYYPISEDSTLWITGNTIRGNGSSYGIYAYYSRPVISGNVIDDFNAGIYCYIGDNAYPYDMSITGNTITNGDYGVRISSWAAPTIHNNNLTDQSAYQVYHQGYRDLDARFNYWGEAATDSMKAGGNPKNILGIYDFYDNASYGQVHYFAYLDTVDGIPSDSVAVLGTVELINGSGTTQQCYQAGDTVFVRVTDTDRDGDPAAVDSVTVLLASSTEGTPETLVIAETDTATGVFEGFILIDSSGTPVPDGALQAVYADYLSAEYNDPVGDFGLPQSDTTGATYLVTLVSGAVSGDETWLKTGNPYIVTGDVIINSFNSLTINAGVEVYFTAGSDDQFSGSNASLSEFYVNGGELFIRGAEGDSVLLTSYAGSPAPGDWQTIYFNGSGRGEVDYCRIEYPVYGVYGNSNNTGDIMVSHTRIENASQYGIYTYYTYAGCDWTVDSNFVTATGSYPLYFNYPRNITATGNIIDTTAGYGIRVSYYETVDSCAIITGNTIYGRGSNYGIYAYNSRPVIRDNYIEDFTIGVYCYMGSESYPYDMTVNGNMIVGGNQAVYAAGYMSPTVNNNTFEGQAQYQVYNMSPRDINARNNYWGAEATDSMNTGGNPKDIGSIYDYFDDPQYGIVNYSGWLDTTGGVPSGSTQTATLELTDTDDNVQPAFPMGDSVFITVNDMDEDQDPGSIDTVYVLLSSTTESVPETVMLLETGITRGIFTGHIITDSSGTPAQDGLLQALIMDDITAVFHDLEDDFGNPGTLATDAMYGVIPISGNINGTVTLTAAEGPYLVTGDIYVSTDDTLYIEPGTRVMFLAGQDDQNGGQNSLRSEIRVENNGYLNAVGTAADSIIFTSSADIPAQGDWQGIYFSNSWGGSRISHAHISYATYGVYSGDTWGQTYAVTNTRIDNASYGLYISWNYAGAVWLADSNHISQTSSYPIYAYYTNSVTLSSNHLEGGGSNGINMRYYTSGDDSSNIIADNIILGDGTNTGIYVYEQRPAVLGNVIDSFATGIYVRDNDDQANPMTIAYNTITGGTQGIYLYNYAEPVIRYNNIYGQSQYQVYNASVRDIDMGFNYWDTLATADMEAGGNPKNLAAVYDNYENGSYGTVTYDNWRDVPVPGAHGPAISSATRDSSVEDIPFVYIGTADHRDGLPVTITFAGYASWLSVSGDTLYGTSTEGMGDTSFTVYADDGTVTDTSRVVLTVVPVNDTPVVTSAAADTATEEQLFVYAAAATDPDNTPVITFENLPSWLSAAGDSVFGTIDDPVSDTVFTVIATDDSLLADTLVVNIRVIAFNDTPVVTSADIDTATEEQPFSYIATAADPDNTPGISFENVPSWLTVSGDTVTGIADDPVSDTSFTVIATDDTVSDTIVVSLAVIPVNDNPVVTSAPADTATEEQAFTYVGTGSDPDNTPVISYADYPAWLSVTGDTITGTPDDPVADTVFLVIATDDSALADTVVMALTVIPVNDPPAITSAAADTATEEQVYSYIAAGSDPDDTPVISFEGYPAWLSVSGDTISGTPDDPVADTAFTVIATDSLLSDTMVVSLAVIRINDVPAVTSAAADTATEEQVFTYVGTAADPDNDPAVSFTGYPAWLSVSGDTISGTPDDPIADTSFMVIGSDSISAGTLAVTLTVIPVNDPPAITSAGTDTATEEIAWSYIATAADPDDTPVITFQDYPAWLNVSGDTISGTADDPVADTVFTVISADGEYADTLVVSLTIIPVNDPPVITSAAADTATEEQPFAYTAAAADPDDAPVISFENVPGWLTVAGDVVFGTIDDPVADTSFTVIATDSVLSDTIVVLVSVIPVNDPPAVTSAGADTATEEVPYTFIGTGTDPDNIPVISYAGYPAWLSVSGDTLSGTPDDPIADTSFLVIATDDSLLADTMTVTLTVIPVNDAPVITSALADTAVEEAAFTYVAAGTDADDTPSLNFEDVPGWLTVSGDTVSGTIDDPVADTSFTVIATDGALSDTEVVVITVIPVNDPPAVTSAAADTATEEQLFTFVGTGTDPDNIPVISYAGYPAWLNVSGDTLSGTPDDPVADTSFLVIATDDSMLADTMVVSLAVVPVNDGPVVSSPLADTATEETAFTYIASAADPDDTPVLSFENVPGWLTVSGDTVSGTIDDPVADTVITVIASDGLLSDTAVVSITVIPVNDPPAVTSTATDTATEEQLFTFVGTGTDPDNIPVISYADYPAWLSVTGDTLSGTPDDPVADTSFLVIATDAGLLADTMVVSLTVIPVNDGPVITSAAADTAVEEQLYTYTAAADDPDDTPVFAFAGYPAWLAAAGNTLSGTPDDPVADTSFMVIAADGLLSDTIIVSLAVTPVNDGPVVTSASVDTATEEQLFSFTATAADPDDTPVITFGSLPSWLSAAGATVSGTPDDPVADTSFMVIAGDGTLSDTMIVDLTVLPVDDIPSVSSPLTDTATEEQVYTYIAAGTDPENAPVSVMYLNLPGWLTVDGDTVSGTADDPVADTVFSVVVNDGALADTARVTLTVIPVNDPPVITLTTADTAVEEQPFLFIPEAADPDGVPSFSIADAPAWLTMSNDSVSGTPDDPVADTGFLLIATDGLLSDTAWIDVFVTPVNDPPVITSPSGVLALEQLPFGYRAAASDPDNVPVISFENVPGWLTVSGDSLSGTPGLGAADTSFTVIAGDGSLADTQAVSITIQGNNNPPAITSAAVAGATEDLVFRYVTTAADPDGNQLVITYLAIPSWMAVDGDTVSGTPAEGTGDTVFTVRATDGFLADTLTVSVTVTPVNDPPVITSAAADTATEEAAYTYTAAADDPDNAPVFVFENLPSWLSAAGNAVSGTPDDPVTDTVFTVIATDGILSDTLAVSLTVMPVNDAPAVTSPFVALAIEQQPLTYVAAAADPDDTPVITFGNLPSWLTASGDTVAGTPGLGAADTSFTVIASDGLLSDTLVVTVTVQDSNSAPVITSAATDTATEDSAYEYVATAADADGNPLLITFPGLPAWLVQAGDTVRGTPLNGEGDAVLTVVAYDGALYDTLAVALTVIPVNDPPAVTSAAADTASEGMAYTYIAAAVDVDDTPSLSFAGLPGWLTAVGDTVSGTPDDPVADTVFSVIASDGEYADTVTVFLTVLPFNDAPVIVSAAADTATELQAYRYTAAAADPDDTPAIRFENVPGWLTADGDTLAGTPPLGSTDTSFTVIAADGENEDTLIVILTVLPDVGISGGSRLVSLIGRVSLYPLPVAQSDLKIAFTWQGGPGGMHLQLCDPSGTVLFSMERPVYRGQQVAAVPPEAFGNFPQTGPLVMQMAVSELVSGRRFIIRRVILQR